jgi:hypothetical protein
MRSTCYHLKAIDFFSILISLVVTHSLLAYLTPDIALKNKLKCFLWGLFLGGCFFIGNILFIKDINNNDKHLYAIMPFIMPFVMNYCYLFCNEFRHQFIERQKKRMEALEKEVKALKERINDQ